MTGWVPSSGASWGGRPLAHRIADTAPRRRIVVTGAITATEVTRWRAVPAFLCRLSDETGQLTLVFGGPRPVAGMVVGARCTVEATSLSNGAGLVLWNPWYRFESREDRCRCPEVSPPPVAGNVRPPEEGTS